MIPVPWATTPTIPSRGTSPGPLTLASGCACSRRAPTDPLLERLIVLVSCLLVLVGGRTLAAPPPAASPGEELARLAQALRQNPAPENYQLLVRFAEDYAESELSAQAAFALGMADLEARRWSPARDRFRAARASQWLGDHAKLQQARAEIELGALEAAGSTLAELFAADSPFSEAARRLEADRLLRAGRAGEAVDWLQRQPDLGQRPALLLALGQAQRAAEQQVAAAETLNRVYYEFPLSHEAEPSNQLLSQLRTELKADYPAPSESLRRTRAEMLWTQGAYRGARSAYLDLSVRASEPARGEARLQAAAALYQLGSLAAACEELGKLARVPPAVEAEFLSYRVRCGLRAGASAAVEADLASLAGQFPTTKWTGEALLAAGHAALARGELVRARDYYGRLLDLAPDGEAAAEAHWKLAWLAYQDREAAAARLLEDHLQRFPESPFLPRALYWRAQVALAAGAESLAERLLAVLRESAPRDYLAQQAEELGRRLQGATAGDDLLPGWLESLSPHRARSPASPAATTVAPPAVRTWVGKANALERLGFPDLASQVLEAALEKQPHPELYRAQARLAFAQQNYARATEILRRAHPNYWRYGLEELPREAWEIMFPRPYWGLIEREARRQELDPYLVAALIRQESRFERDAVSSAGALGLMQLMPATARRLAGAARLSPSRITDPELNIRLGARYLAELLRRFNGSLEKAVAGYNAGGTRVQGWASQGGVRQTAEFVESIPVTQTREFVYTVLRNYRFYRDLYAAPELPAAAATTELAPAPPPR